MNLLDIYLIHDKYKIYINVYIVLKLLKNCNIQWKKLITKNTIFLKNKYFYLF